MSQAQQNQIDELRIKVQELAKQVQELNSLLKPAPIELLKPKRKYTRHIQPQ